METLSLSPDERLTLLQLARQSIDYAVRGRRFEPDLQTLSPRLREDGVCFVTLFMPGGELRGCIGGLEATQPLALDVCQHAASAAMDDYRFNPVRSNEVPLLQIEISRLTPPEPLVYEHPEDLPRLLHPKRDGVVLRDGVNRATVLPQVWDKLPDPEDFLSQLCLKMGAPADLWRRRKLKVEIYQVEEFAEPAK
jgi:AmmeMemoRadiSam system protein A